MKTIIFTIVALLLVSLPGLSQPGERGWTSTYRLNIDAEGKEATFQGDKVDTTEFIFWEGLNYCIDSLEFSVKTTDTTRYRTALLFGNGNTTPYANYRLASGVGLDTLSAVLPALNGVRVPWSVIEKGTQKIALVVDFSAAGNHAQASRIAALKYEVWVKAHFKYKKIP